MIDFVKIRTNQTGISESLRQNPQLEFFGKVNIDTGEQQVETLTAKLKNLSISLFASGLVEITGSLHKYANEGQHNYDAFTFERLTATIKDLTGLLGIRPDALTLHNVEFGVNVQLGMKPSKFLDSILNYRFKLPDVRTFGGCGYLKQWVQQNYILKVYDKKHQYRISSNILRFEIKVMAMSYLKDLNIYTLADLLEVSKLECLGDKLTKTYEGLLIGEKLNTGQMTRPERKVYEQGANPNFWRDLPDRKQRNYYRKKFAAIIKKYGFGVHECVAELIAEEVGKLLKSSDILPASQKQNLGHFTTSNKGVKRLTKQMPTVNPQMPHERRCKICGTPIGHRRKNAVFCEKRKCRNADSNPRNRFKYLFNKMRNQPSLYDFKDLLKHILYQQKLLVDLDTPSD